MMKRLLEEFTIHRQARHSRVESMLQAVRACTFIRKGQHQMMADFLMLELLEQGRI